MPQARKQASVRRAVSQRANGLCEYCRCPDDCSPTSFQVEHAEPESAGGADEGENLAWSCGGCNSHKATATAAPDPLTGALTPLFHPRRDRWDDHFAWSADSLSIEGKTASGRATTARLRLNRREVINLRRLLIVAGKHPAKA